MGPKLMNCCRSDQVGTKEYGKMLKRIQILEDGRVLATEVKCWKFEGQKSGITRKEYQRLLNGRFHGAKRIVESSKKKKALQGRGALSREE